MPTLDEAIEYIRMGERDTGRQMLEEILEQEEANEEVWLWLSSVVDSDEDREICLENVLALNPDNIVAQKGLEALQSGSFNVNDLLSEVLEEAEEFEEEDEDDGDEATFLDDFIVSDYDDDDFNTPKKTAKSKIMAGGKFALTPKILIILAVIAFIVLALVAVAGFTLIGGAGDNGGDVLPAGVTAESPQQVETPTPADSPTPAPTDTPPATFTPSLQLPTAAPTLTPSPTSTTVVSPTPGG